MASRAAQLLIPTKSTLVLATALLAIKRTFLRPPSVLTYVFGWLLLLNWPNLPLMWHWRVWILVLLQARKEQFLAYLGLHRGNKGGRSRELRLPKKYWHLKGVGISPFAAKSYMHGKVGWAQGDLYWHMSNSEYPAFMDGARFQWACQFLGPAFVYEKLTLPLAGVSIVFFKEISMFQEFTVETRAAAFTDRWSFILCIFTTTVSKRSKGRDIIIQTPQGDRTLCCVGLAKIVCKLATRQESIQPLRVLSASGFGPDASNWDRIQAARAHKQGIQWVASNEGEHGLELYQEQNDRALEVIARLGGHEKKAVWLELLKLLQSFESQS